MDVHIGQMASTVEVGDAQLLERLVEEALRRLRAEQAYERRVAEELRLHASVLDGEGS